MQDLQGIFLAAKAKDKTKMFLDKCANNFSVTTLKIQISGVLLVTDQLLSFAVTIPKKWIETKLVVT